MARNWSEEPLVVREPPVKSTNACVEGLAEPCCGLLCGAILLAPLICLCIAFTPTFPVALSTGMLTALAVGVPLVCLLLLMLPLPVYNPDPYSDSFLGIGFSVNGAEQTFGNYYKLLATYPGSSKNWRVAAKKWFEDRTQGDPNVGYGPGGNTKMYYDFKTCKKKLLQIGPKIAAGTLKRESCLALCPAFNNILWPQAGRMCLGYKNDDHAFVRPFFAKLCDNGEGRPGGWTMDRLRSEFRKCFAATSVLDTNNGQVTRLTGDIINPSKSKTIVTEWVITILHKVTLDMDITAVEAKELATLQTYHLVVAFMTGTMASGLLYWNMFTKWTLKTRALWAEKHKVAIKKKWRSEDWTNSKLDLMASAYMDMIMFAGGRSVPLAIDLVMGYILTRNKPPGIVGVNFTKEDNIRKLMMETMRMHPPVTTLPMWVKGSGNGPAWEQDMICLDRALADPTVFPNPDAFLLGRPGQQSEENPDSNSMAWGDFALVDGDNADGDSHRCPAKQMSIAMTTAFVMEYQASGPWTIEDDNITFTYYGTSGWKCTKAETAQRRIF